MKKKVLMTTVHPAPYMDMWFYKIKEEYDLTVLYNHSRDSAKTWKNFVGYDGIILDNIPLYKMFAFVYKADLTIWGGYSSPHLLFGIILSWLLRKKTAIFTDHPFHQNIIADIFKKIFLYRIIDYVFCATEVTQTFIENKYRSVTKGKTRFFPYAVDIPSSVNIITNNNDNIQILVANNFIPRKGYSVLFEALSHLNDYDRIRENYHFIILGHGIEENKYKELAKKLCIDIKFYGWMEPQEYKRMMDKVDVYIHPSIEEPFGIPPIDAMGKGKVVIVSDGVKSTERIIRNGENGYVYPANDANELIKILLSLDKSKFNRIKENAHEDSKKYYSLNQNMNTIRDVFKDY